MKTVNKVSSVFQQSMDVVLTLTSAAIAVIFKVGPLG